MRLALVVSLALAAPAVAKPPPSAPALFTDVRFPALLGPEGRATVTVSVSVDATDLKVEVSGVDGLLVDPDNRLVVKLNALHAGQPFVFEVGYRAPATPAALSISSSARLGRTPASLTRTFAYAATGPGPAVTPPPAQVAPSDVAALRRGLPEGQVVRVEAWVLDSYRCPPCPPGAMCKPCMMQSALFLGAGREHPRFPLANPPADVAVVGVQFPGRFEHGTRYALDVRAATRTGATMLDGVVLQAWKDGAPVPLDAPPPPPPGPTGTAPPQPAPTDLAALHRGLPDGQVVRLDGWVLDSYLCPPCPPKALCKPCLMQSAIFLGGTRDHARFPLANPPPDVAVVGVPSPGQFATGVRYTLDVRATAKAGPSSLDAVVLQAWQDGRPVALDAPPPPPPPPPPH